jgi:pyruvate/2-oxoglutarate dehydrogenase complex dihydrolipoamide dehydrogenase (E3) component
MNCYVDSSDLKSAGFDVVIVATGGLQEAVDVEGGQLAIESWDVLTGAKRVSGKVLVFDDHGGNQALDLTETLARAGATVELVTPERNVSPDVGGMVASRYFTDLSKLGVRFTVLRHLNRIVKNSDGTFEVELGLEDEIWTESRTVDAVVVENGTVANEDLYRELISDSSNGGEVHLEDLLNGRKQQEVRNPEGEFQLFRIGDAISSRNIHTAMLDAVRICRAI